LTVEIQTDSGGVPSNTAITNGVSEGVAESSVGAGFGYVTFNFPTAPAISANTQYHIVLKTTRNGDDVNNTNWGNSGAAGNTYANGTPNGKRSGAWETIVENDFNFVVNGRGN